MCRGGRNDLLLLQMAVRSVKSISSSESKVMSRFWPISPVSTSRSLKYQTQKLHSWTQKCTPLSMCKRITNKQTFQYMNFYSCHPPGVKKGFIKGEALRLLGTNSSHSTFNKNMQSFKTSLKNRGRIPK